MSTVAASCQALPTGPGKRGSAAWTNKRMQTRLSSRCWWFFFMEFTHLFNLVKPVLGRSAVSPWKAPEATSPRGLFPQAGKLDSHKTNEGLSICARRPLRGNLPLPALPTCPSCSMGTSGKSDMTAPHAGWSQVTAHSQRRSATPEAEETPAIDTRVRVAWLPTAHGHSFGPVRTQWNPPAQPVVPCR